MSKQISLLASLGLGLACTLALASPITAQISDPNQINPQSNEKDGLFGDSTLGVNPLDLIHNLNLRVGQSAQEFNESSGTQIQDSAAEFRRLQQERILQQYNNTPETATETP